MMDLPGPKRSYALLLNLRLVEAMEKEGSLVDLAARLTAGAVTEEEAQARLCRAYQAAGCLLPQEALRRFLGAQGARALLGEILLHLLAPLFEMGAVQPGEALPAQGG